MGERKWMEICWIADSQCNNRFVSDYNVLSYEWPWFNSYLVIIELKEQNIFAFVKEKLSLTLTITHEIRNRDFTRQVMTVITLLLFP